MKLDLVEVEGTWYDIGLAEGSTQKSLVRYTVHRYARVHAGTAGYQALDRVTARVEEFVGRLFPEEWEELLGIADGAEVDLSLLVAANFPRAVAALAGKAGDEPPEEQCSNLLFPASEWGPLLGGTLDDDPIRFLLHARPEGGLPFCCIMWPGCVACTWGGMNAAGLALCGASAKPLLPEHARTETRINGLEMLNPQRVLLRSCRTVGEALERLSNPDLDAGNNYSLLDAAGRGAQVQGYAGAGQGLRVLEMPADRGICCGNFHTWEIGPRDFSRFPDKADVFSRYTGLARAVADNVGRYSVGAMKEALIGHDGDPATLHSVCNDNTIVAMIAAPRAGRLLFASRPPCIEGFDEYAVA